MDEDFIDFVDEENTQQEKRHRRGSYGRFSEEENDYEESW